MFNKIKLISAIIVAVLAATYIPKLLKHLKVVESSEFTGLIIASIIILIIGIIISIILSQIIGRMIAKSVTNKILDKIEEGLMTAIETDHRLSFFEMKAVKTLIVRTLQRDLPSALIAPFIIFYILGAIFLLLEAVYFF